MPNRLFVLGLLFGVGLGVGAMLLFDTSGTGPARASPRPADLEPEASPAPAEAEVPPPMLAVRDAPSEAAAFPPGEAVLRIGDGYVFGSEGVERFDEGDDEDQFDVICQDIRYGIVLRTPHGAVRVAPPFNTSGEPLDPEVVYDLVEDAPPDLPDRNASIPSRPASKVSGVSFVRSGDGRTFKVRVLERLGDPRAWMRRIRIAYAEVPTKAGGGQVSIPGEPVLEPLDETSQALLQRFQDAPKVPSDTFKSFLQGNYQRVTDLPDELVLRTRRYVALPDPLTTKITTRAYSGIVAEQGIAAEGTIEVRSYTGIGVEGDVAGTIDVRSYAYAHITGDVHGTINCGSYATLVIDGNVYGTIKVGSYVTLYLKGRLMEPSRNLKAGGSCWSTFFFDQHHVAADLERMPATKQITLHVRSSDLPAGKHALAPWREVIVADDLWEKLH